MNKSNVAVAAALLVASAIRVSVAAPSATTTDKFAGLAPEIAAKTMTLPPGFRVKLFAGEPDVRQPIAFAIDDRGRFWVAENYSYPLRQPQGKGTDRIIIFEDVDGDGGFDKRTVFLESLNMVTALELGFGGVWVGAAPNLLFIPRNAGEDKPSGPAEVVLDGWGYQDTHNTLSTFVWGPDGWLYGGHGIASRSRVGKPGTPEVERQSLDGGVWRYHPTKKKFEVFAEGNTNPWGVDFNDEGQLFTTGCVIPHLWHSIQGGRYQRLFGQHQNPHTYDDIKTIADHRHWAGEDSHAGRDGYREASGELKTFEEDFSVGGGHAHAGGMIYLGGSWPEKYRNQILMNNLHGHRLNLDFLERKGSGYVGRHGPDFLLTNDKWSLILNLQYGPDGSVYMIDWYDKNLCHNTTPTFHDRSNGRIYKIVYGEEKPAKVDLGKLSNLELVKLQLDKNDWYVRHARRILQERAQVDGPDANVHEELLKILTENPDVTRKLRALWALHVTGGLSERLLLSLLDQEHPYLRAWSVQLLCEERNPSATALKKLVALADDKSAAASPIVRLYLAAALQRIPLQYRWDLVEALCSHDGDQSDGNIPLLVWYGMGPLVSVDQDRALALAVKAEFNPILKFTTRRVASVANSEAHAAIVRTLLPLVGKDEKRELEVLSGFQAALKGRRSAPMPVGWSGVENDYGATGSSDLRALVDSLSLTFGSAKALDSLQKIARDSSAEVAKRVQAIESLLLAKPPSLAPLLQELLKEPGLRGVALQGLVNYDDPETPNRILKLYGSFSEAHQRDALNTLAARASYAETLVQAVESGELSKQALTADLVRHLRSMNNSGLNARLENVWGAVRETTEDKQMQIERFRKLYETKSSQPNDASRGRAVFSRTCQQCHKLFGSGGEVGPDLTGSNRSDLEYILQNMIDPNAVIPNEYRAFTLETKDDRIVTGIVKAQDENAVTLLTGNEVVTVPRNEIHVLQQSQLSMMPEGLLDALTEQEVRDLIFYLGMPKQAPLPK